MQSLYCAIKANEGSNPFAPILNISVNNTQTMCSFTI